MREESIQSVATEKENLINLKKAMEVYYKEKIAEMLDRILNRFNDGEIKLDDPSDYTHEGVVYENFVWKLGLYACKSDFDRVFFGIIIAKAMSIDPEFDELVRKYISAAQAADEEAWAKREECYSKDLAFEQKHKPGSDWKPTYLLDPNDGRYTQGKYMTKYILNEF